MGTQNDRRDFLKQGAAATAGLFAAEAHIPVCIQALVAQLVVRLTEGNSCPDCEKRGSHQSM